MMTIFTIIIYIAVLLAALFIVASLDFEIPNSFLVVLIIVLGYIAYMDYTAQPLLGFLK